MKTIKNILVPVDYSNNSKAAFEYAVAMGKDLGAETIKVLFVHYDYAINAPLAEPPIILPSKSREELTEDLQKFVADETYELSDIILKSKINITTEVAFGMPHHTIVLYSETGHYDLVVVGKAGETNLDTVWFGSTATEVSQKSACPILLIPAQTIYKGVKEMIYACDFDHKSPKHIEVVADIAKALHTDVELVYVKIKEDDESRFMADVNSMYSIFKESAPLLNFTVHAVEADSVVEGINEFAKKVEADFITIVTKHRSFWQRLIHSSMTKKLVMYAELPILVIHVED